jgi:hypothetical protein
MRLLRAMAAAAAVLLAAAAAGARAEGGAGAIAADPATFPALVQGHALVKFYAPWCARGRARAGRGRGTYYIRTDSYGDGGCRCGHCKRLEPAYAELAGLAQAAGTVQVAKVDCTVHGDLCHKYDVKGYPHLAWFANGAKVRRSGEGGGGSGGRPGRLIPGCRGGGALRWRSTRARAPSTRCATTSTPRSRAPSPPCPRPTCESADSAASSVVPQNE